MESLVRLQIEFIVIPQHHLSDRYKLSTVIQTLFDVMHTIKSFASILAKLLVRTSPRKLFNCRSSLSHLSHLHQFLSVQQQSPRPQYPQVLGKRLRNGKPPLGNLIQHPQNPCPLRLGPSSRTRNPQRQQKQDPR